MDTILNKVVLITGASSGIGEATARVLCRAGASVVLGARRTERLQKVVQELKEEGGQAEYCTLDVTNLEQMHEFVAFAQQKFGRVDVFINNAGVMPLSPLDSYKVEEWNQMIDVNIRGVLHGIASGLPVMEKQQTGHFINIASVGAYQVSPTAAVYCATKFAVRAITEGLRQESSGHIQVTLVSPGVTESELADHISDEQARAEMKEYRRISIPASAIANAILYAIEQPQEVDINEIIIRPTATS
ncbi:SDR family oxidoreductase [Paenibacillus kyungheensis]|uniref:SDR family oxidoreductase n=1 Tax=Paenibacillus kyungheensis TaxID=1452732 RepID=A0AAX3M7T7_9BACL|nr:SDR family oxidoreductase [Paenibacillus kyungheensis]WCT57976.1 SDR family oxidoreductase [Paenibacillus kyungheensis]